MLSPVASHGRNAGVLMEQQSASSFVAVKRRRVTFAECICFRHGRSADDFVALAWRFGARWPTRCLRPLILYFAPRYFEAEDVHLERAAECCRRNDIDEEMQLMRTSYLRRGLWRHLGFGLNGDRLLRHYDGILEAQVIAMPQNVGPVRRTRPRAVMVMGQKAGS